MKRLVFVVVFVVSVLGVRVDARGQGHIIRFLPILDSTTITFGLIDSLIRHIRFQPLIIFDTSHADSTNTHLWQIGNTNKSFFADSGAVRGIIE